MDFQESVKIKHGNILNLQYFYVQNDVILLTIFDIDCKDLRNLIRTQTEVDNNIISSYKLLLWTSPPQLDC